MEVNIELLLQTPSGELLEVLDRGVKAVVYLLEFGESTIEERPGVF